MFRSLPLVSLLAAAVLVSACNNSLSNPSTPTTTPTQITDSFSGTVTVNGAAAFPFTVQQTGSITATLAALTPDASVTVGLALGTWNGTACQLIITNDAALANTTVTGNATGTGTFCVRVYDTGHLTASSDFTVTVVHY